MRALERHGCWLFDSAGMSIHAGIRCRSSPAALRSEIVDRRLTVETVPLAVQHELGRPSREVQRCPAFPAVGVTSSELLFSGHDSKRWWASVHHGRVDAEDRRESDPDPYQRPCLVAHRFVLPSQGPQPPACACIHKLVKPDPRLQKYAISTLTEDLKDHEAVLQRTRSGRPGRKGTAFKPRAVPTVSRCRGGTCALLR